MIPKCLPSVTYFRSCLSAEIKSLDLFKVKEEKEGKKKSIASNINLKWSKRKKKAYHATILFDKDKTRYKA